MDIFPLAAGTALSVLATIGDSSGSPPSYTTPPPLSARLWPGGQRSASFAVAASWADLAAGKVTLTISPGQTTGLESGRYRGELLVQDPTLGSVVAYEWAVDIQASPGNQPESPSYCTYEQMLNYARSWLKDIQSEDDEAGFAEQRGRARSWLDDLILAGRPARGTTTIGSPGSGVRDWSGGSAVPNTWLRQQLDGDLLIRRGWVVEATAKMALSYICESQIGPGDSAQQYVNLGRMYKVQASTLATTSVAEIADTNGNPIYGVNIGAMSFR